MKTTDGSYTGVSIDLWESLAVREGYVYEYDNEPELADCKGKMIPAVKYYKQINSNSQKCCFDAQDPSQPCLSVCDYDEEKAGSVKTESLWTRAERRCVQHDHRR